MGRLTLRRDRLAALLAMVFLTAVILGGARGQLLDYDPASTEAEPRYWGPPFTPERTAGISTPLVTLATPSIDEEIDRETRWLIACQMPDGAIAQTPLGQEIVPYFGNLAAKTLIEIDSGRARDYMRWYLGHLNRPDRWGLAGTIYDYERTEEGLSPTLDYDSADSYAATFLSLASHYLMKTGDRDFIESNLGDIELVARVLPALQGTDGLVVVAPGSNTRFLMDNSEAYRGLTDWAEALLLLGYPEKATPYRDAAEKIREGIERVLYSPSRGQYAHTLSWYGKRYPKPGKWYPDAVSQLDVITSGVIRADDQKAYRIWSDFNAQFPLWQEGATSDGFPWAKIALTAAMMGDNGRAEEFLAWASEEYGQKARRYPWYVLESASIIDLYRELSPAPAGQGSGAPGSQSPQTSEAN